MPLDQNSSIPDFNNLEDLNHYLLTEGCRRCDLGSQPGLHGCCISRGNPRSNKMVLAEAPAEEEDIKRIPLCGPAGRLLDKIWASVGMDTNDWYCTNITLCRRIAPPGSGKKNLPATSEQVKLCRPFLDQQIDLLSPSLIVTLGKPATEALLGKRIIRMGDYRGKLIDGKRYLYFPMFHPAALLHSKRDPEKYQQYRRLMWNDIRQLKRIIQERNL